MVHRHFSHPTAKDAWYQGIALLAQLPNVSCKISGMVMFHREFAESQVRPLAEHVYQAFGAQRCMLGSNFPVDGLHLDYQQLWLNYMQWFAGLGAENKRQLFSRNAELFYRI